MSGKFQEEYKRKLISAEDAAKLINTGDKIYGGMATANPVGIMNAVGKRAMAGEFDNVEYLLMGQLLGEMDWLKPEYSRHLRLNEAFVLIPQVRNMVNAGYADYLVNHGSTYPKLVTDYRIKDLPKEKVKVMASVSPMDKFGYFSMACSPGPFLESARLDNTTVILEVNQNQPRIFGDNFLHISEVDHVVEYDFKLPSLPSPPITEVDQAIANIIVDMIDDGSTIQLGIGGMPNILGKLLETKNDLGAHTEMVGDAFRHLWELGVLNGKKKTVRPYKMTACFSMASPETYEWMHENPVIEMYSQGWTNNPQVIAQNYKMTAINSAMEVDLTGQVASESIGPLHYSGTGGQFHFTQGAQLSPGGKAFICLASSGQTKEGRISKIVPLLKHGAVVTTPRSEVHYVVTEYGAVELKGMTFAERAKALISIAHPDFRGELRQEAKKLGILL